MFARVPFVSVIVLAAVAFLSLAAATPADAQVKVAVIDIQKVLAESASGKAAQTEIEALQQAKRSELEAKRQELLDLRKRAEEGALSLAEDKLAELQKEYEDKAIAFKRLEDDANRELQKRGEQLMGKIERQILPVINQLGQEQGYTLIFNKFQSGLVYAADSVDITGDVIARLDATNAGG